MQGEGTMEIHSGMKKVLKEDSLSYSKAETRVPGFQTGYFGVMDEPRLEHLTSTAIED